MGRVCLLDHRVNHLLHDNAYIILNKEHLEIAALSMNSHELASKPNQGLSLLTLYYIEYISVVKQEGIPVSFNGVVDCFGLRYLRP